MASLRQAYRSLKARLRYEPSATIEFEARQAIIDLELRSPCVICGELPPCKHKKMGGT
jgi:hypothetical protein